MKQKLLLLEGNHSHEDWPETSRSLQDALTASDLFEVEVHREARPERLRHDFADCDVVLPHYSPLPDERGEPLWPAATRAAFERYVREGGGLVIVHAASNAFARWPAYNRMIGLGGWGGRGPDAGDYAYLDEAGQRVTRGGPGACGHHEPQHEYHVEIRQPGHPIVAGMPPRWLHSLDEAYGLLRGPAEQMEILATVFAGKTPEGSQRHEPAAMTVRFGAGRVFHTTLGHSGLAMACVGFRTLLVRGAEWAATGAVTYPLPSSFPGPEAASLCPTI